MATIQLGPYHLIYLPLSLFQSTIIIISIEVISFKITVATTEMGQHHLNYLPYDWTSGSYCQT